MPSAVSVRLRMTTCVRAAGPRITDSSAVTGRSAGGNIAVPRELAAVRFAIGDDYNVAAADVLGDRMLRCAFVPPCRDDHCPPDSARLGRAGRLRIRQSR
jgi:hypothetical protein